MKALNAQKQPSFPLNSFKITRYSFIHLAGNLTISERSVTKRRIELRLIESDDLLFEFEKSKKLTLDIFKLISPRLEDYSYQPNKWTTKEVLRHIIDMERVFAYRAFRFSRFDDTELSGVDENDYIENVKPMNTKLIDLQEEYLAVRNSSIWIYKNIKPEMLDFKGIANSQTSTVRALGFAMIGHNIHHCNFIKANYIMPS